MGAAKYPDFLPERIEIEIGRFPFLTGPFLMPDVPLVCGQKICRRSRRRIAERRRRPDRVVDGEVAILQAPMFDGLSVDLDAMG